MFSKSLLTGLSCALVLMGAPPEAQGAEVVSATFAAKGYPGSRERHYSVYVPSTYDGHTPTAMLMVLHGCKQTERDMLDQTSFNALADRDGFIVVYPFITSYDGSRSQNCWGFWFDQHIHEGAGEVEDLYQLGREVETRFAIDPQRRYVTGLSSGGAMAVALAVARSEYFAAAGAAAGLPYAESSWSVSSFCYFPGLFRSVAEDVDAMRREQRASADQRVIPLMIVQSNNDCTVKAAAAEHLRDAWLDRYGVAPAAFEADDCSAEGVRCTRRRYGTPDRSVVETVFYDGASGGFFSGSGAHYWVGDGSGEFANPTGPSASQLFWNFFLHHRLDVPPALPSQ